MAKNEPQLNMSVMLEVERTMDAFPRAADRAVHSSLEYHAQAAGAIAWRWRCLLAWIETCARGIRGNKHRVPGAEQAYERSNRQQQGRPTGLDLGKRSIGSCAC
jgi:hypothetical protein